MRNYREVGPAAILVFALVCLGARAAEHEGHGGHSKPGDAAKGHVAQSDKDKELVAKQDAAYPLKTCVVTGEKLGGMGDAVNYIYNDRLVKFCCKGCIKKFEADPAKYLALIDAAAKGGAKKAAVAKPHGAHGSHGTSGGGCGACGGCDPATDPFIK
jgi:hypothetical protein